MRPRRTQTARPQPPIRTRSRRRKLRQARPLFRRTKSLTCSKRIKEAQEKIEELKRDVESNPAHI